MTGYSTPSPSHHEPALHPSTRGQSCPTHCTGTAISTPRTWLKEPACPTPCASTRPDGHQEGLRPRAVRVHGKRINSCLALAAMKADCLITVSEGIAQSNNLHALQTAFIEHDAFQCGYCAPGANLLGRGPAERRTRQNHRRHPRVGEQQHLPLRRFHQPIDGLGRRNEPI